MKFSLLFRNYVEETKNTIEYDEMSNTVYDLAIDRAAKKFCRNSESFSYFLETVKQPLKSPEDIKYRQDILLDFVEMPKLLEELRMIFKSYDSLQSDWHDLCSSIYTYGVPSTVKGLLDCTYDSLRATSTFARSTVSYFKAISDAVDKYDVKSEGLIGIKKFCTEMTVNESLDEISKIGEMFQRDNVSSYEFRIRVGSDDTMTVRRASLTDISEIESKSLGKSLKKFIGNIGKGGQNADELPEIAMGQYHVEEAMKILNEALYEVYSVMSGITGDIYEFFRGLSGELSFYDSGLALCRYLTGAGLPMCMPKVVSAENDCFRVKDIYDIQLIEEGVDKIITNTIDIDGEMDGVLIRGANTSGKTSFLRSMGTAQILAQSGLPVCAAAAEISVRNAVLTLFASSEEEFVVGDAAGRFEGEVQEMARILDHIVPYTLLLLNESFQTTAYREGALGMQRILRVLPRVRCKYVFVTWLMQMFDLLKDNNIKHMQMGGEGHPSYKIHPVEK